MPSNARAKYWNDLSNVMWSMTAYAVKIDALQDQFTLDAYNALMFSKGLLLESEKSLGAMIRKFGTKEDVAQYSRMIFLQNQLSKQEIKSDSIGSIYTQIDRIDKQLAQKYSSYGNYTHFLDLQYEDIRKALKDGEVVVDFTDYKLDSIHCYGAYVLRKEWKYPLLIPLFTQEQLDVLYGGIHKADQLYQSPQSNEFLKLCWEPLSSYIQPGSKVYYVPSGTLHQVSLESLPLAADSLLGDKYRFIRVSSSREVGKKQTSLHTKKKRAVLYGGLYYDVDMSVMKKESEKYDLSRLFALRSGGTSVDSVYHYLPMTGEEVNDIANILARHQMDTLLYVGATGTEESFFHLDGRSPQIIHLATHGFYYVPEDKEPISGITSYQDAMRFSGLIMSGGNAVRRSIKLPEGTLDGIMTATEISRIDLSGTELVVLSACETGLGKVNSEGVYGLQRAFKKAGVQTLVMSLWKISDRITKEFMLHFYANLAKSEWDKRKAFDEAKAMIRQLYPEPFYWAGFIMLD